MVEVRLGMSKLATQTTFWIFMKHLSFEKLKSLENLCVAMLKMVCWRYTFVLTFKHF